MAVIEPSVGCLHCVQPLNDLGIKFLQFDHCQELECWLCPEQKREGTEGAGSFAVKSLCSDQIVISGTKFAVR